MSPRVGGPPGAAGAGAAINLFVCERMEVAAKLQAHTKNWSDAWQILRRLLVYEDQPDVGVDHDDIAGLAAVLERLNPLPGVVFVRKDKLGSHHVKRAYCGVGEPDPSLEVDFSCDIVPAMDRFPTFPSAARQHRAAEPLAPWQV